MSIRKQKRGSSLDQKSGGAQGKYTGKESTSAGIRAWSHPTNIFLPTALRMIIRHSTLLQPRGILCSRLLLGLVGYSDVSDASEMTIYVLRTTSFRGKFQDDRFRHC